jgi:DNA-binding NarL/FixJ family response regulator
MPLDIVIADDHRIVREGVASLLSARDEFRVCSFADDGIQLLEKVAELAPDIALVDISMPAMNGIEATRRITSEHPEVLVIMLSMNADQRLVTESLNAGAKGYILKDSAFEELENAIRVVVAGGYYLSTKIDNRAMKNHLTGKQDNENTVFSILTGREREVLQLIAEGKNTKEIAFAFNVSTKTVETQRQQIMKKLNLFSVAQLTKYAIKQGVTTTD